MAQIISQRRAEDEATPLHIAALFGHKDVIRALLVRLSNKNSFEKLEIFKHLKLHSQNAGAIVDVRPTKGDNCGKTPYDVANESTKSTFHVYFFEQVAMGNTSTIQRLLDGGLQVDIRDGSSSEDSALHWACSFGNIDVAQALLSNGIDANIVNKHNQTALHIAAKSNKLEIVKLLLDEAADVNMQDSEGKNAAQYTTSSEITGLLESPPSPSCCLRKEFENRQQAIFKSLQQSNPIVVESSATVVASGQPSTNESTPKSALVEDSCLDDSCSLEVNELDDVLLVFWPPVQRQSRPINRQPFSINSADNLLICMSNSDIDLFPILTWTGFMDVIDNYGFQAQVKRSAKGAKIRLCLNPHLCPIREGYQISVNIDQVVITGADYAGLTYGVHTFLQLLQLHSLINKDQSDVTYVKIPAINIIDFPKIPVRSMLWSYRKHIQFQDEFSRDFVEMISKLRINSISLVINAIDIRTVERIDATSIKDGEPKSLTSPSHASSSPSVNEAQIFNSASTKEKTFLLDELCDKHCIEIVPTVFISSIYDR